MKSTRNAILVRQEFKQTLEHLVPSELGHNCYYTVISAGDRELMAIVPKNGLEKASCTVDGEKWKYNPTTRMWSKKDNE